MDTDQIIPARFLVATTRTGLGSALFANWRYDEASKPRLDFPLNHVDPTEVRILVAGRNFGCGSSREHAVWALQEWGIQAIVAPSFADIFRTNSIKNGLVPIALEGADFDHFTAHLRGAPGSSVTIDVEREEVRIAAGRSYRFNLDTFSRACLVHGIDELDYLRGMEPHIAAFEQRTSRVAERTRGSPP